MIPILFIEPLSGATPRLYGQLMGLERDEALPLVEWTPPKADGLARPLPMMRSDQLLLPTGRSIPLSLYDRDEPFCVAVDRAGRVRATSYRTRLRTAPREKRRQFARITPLMRPLGDFYRRRDVEQVATLRQGGIALPVIVFRLDRRRALSILASPRS